jgi:DNA mismatch repair protein MSH5
VPLFLLQLFCMESSDDTTGPFRHQLLQLAKLHVRPRVIYASSKADTELLAVLRAPLAGGAGGAVSEGGHGNNASAEAAAAGGGSSGECEVRTERSTLFLPRQARAVLEAVHVRGTPPGLSTRERLHRLNTMVSLSAEQQVCAAGALLAVLVREGRMQAPAPGEAAHTAAGGGNGGEDTSGGSSGALLSLASISEVSLEGYLAVDPASLAALQIFQEEQHPAAAMGIGRRLLAVGRSWVPAD